MSRDYARGFQHGVLCAIACVLIAYGLTGCAVDIDLPRVTPEHYDNEMRVADAYPDEVDEAYQAWRTSFGEPTGCDHTTLYVVTVEAEDRCMQPDGCLLCHTSPIWPDTCTIAVVDEQRATDVVSRELRRWLKECSGSATYGWPHPQVRTSEYLMGCQGPYSHMDESQPKDVVDELSTELASRDGSRARPDTAYHLATLRSLRLIWERLGAGMTPRAVSTELMERNDYSRATADRWVGSALRVLHEDGATEPIESKRARIVTMALGGYEKAMAREKGFLVSTFEDGERVSTLEKMTDPDFKAAAAFLAILAKIELGL